MKRILFLALALCAGCSSQYRITLNNGQTVTTLNKPVLDKSKNFYTYEALVTVPAGAVREIEPASYKPANKSKGDFLPAPTTPQ